VFVIVKIFEKETSRYITYIHIVILLVQEKRCAFPLLSIYVQNFGCILVVLFLFRRKCGNMYQVPFGRNGGQIGHDRKISRKKL
jgi:hypothetical protein